MSPVNSGMLPFLQDLIENAPHKPLFSVPFLESRNAKSIPESPQGAEKVKPCPQHLPFQWLALGTSSELLVRAVSSAWLTSAHSRQNGSCLWLFHDSAHPYPPQRQRRVRAVCGFCHLSILRRPAREGAGQAGVSPLTGKSFQQPTPFYRQPEPFSESHRMGL